MSDEDRRSKRLAELPNWDYKALGLRGQYILKPPTLQFPSSVEQAECSSSSSNIEEHSEDEHSEESVAAEDSIVFSDDSTDTDTLTSDTEVSPPDAESTRLEVHTSETMTTVHDEKEVLARLNIVVAGLTDYIDENSMHSSTTGYYSVEDIDACVTRVESVRTTIRELNHQMRDTVGDTIFMSKYNDTLNNNLHTIKEYIREAKMKKAALRNNDSKLELQDRQHKVNQEHEAFIQKQATAKFLIGEVTRMIQKLNTEFVKDNDSATDEDIESRKGQLAENTREADNLSNKFQKVLEILPESYPNRVTVVAEMTRNYDTVMKNKDIYKRTLEEEIKSRELEKEKTFSSSAINVQLKPFEGFVSELDIYSFRSEFEKLYKKMPTSKLPDILKHNHLKNPALAMVKSLDKIEEIWERLLKAYGDPKTILSKLLADVKTLGPIWKMRNSDEIKDGLINLINGIRDLIKVAKQHNIEAKLYNGDGLEIIYNSMGDNRVTRWLTSICDDELADEQLWGRLLKFLERDLRVQQEKALYQRKANPQEEGRRPTPRQGGSHYGSPGNPLCSYCGEGGHVTTNGLNGIQLVQYYACKTFVESTTAERFRSLRSKGFCHQCLYPGARLEGKHSAGTCQALYVCKHNSHERHTCKKHVLVCHEHCENPENIECLERYKRKYIVNHQNLEEFSKNIQLSFHSSYSTSPKQPSTLVPQPDDAAIVTDSSVYLLQRIYIDGEFYTIFYDNGCSDFVCKYEAVQRLGKRAIKEPGGPLSLGGVGDTVTLSEHGLYTVRLPMINGKNSVLTGVCLNKITSTFPEFILDGEVQNDIRKEYAQADGDVNDLPTLPHSVGGTDIDFMIGAKFLRDFPLSKFRTLSGLTIYESLFVSPDGSRGTVCGPHRQFNDVLSCNMSSFYTKEYMMYEAARKKLGINLDPIYKGEPNDFDIYDEEVSTWSLCDEQKHKYLAAKQLKQFENCENAGSEITFRCLDCRNCPKCKQGSRIDLITRREEVEQQVINESVTVDLAQGLATARLPLIADPKVKLAPNKKRALGIYNKVLRSLEGKEELKQAVIASEQKLQTRGKVDWVCNLSPELQEMLQNNPVKNFIPWLIQQNDNSITTAVRLVFHGSDKTPSGYALNDITAKGRNSLNKLVEVAIRWLTYPIAFHTDVQMMYNSVLLHEEDWCMQRYIYQEKLDPKMIAKEKVIKTVIYGNKASGNQAEYALRETARLQKDDYPRVNEVVRDEFYMDDCLSGGHDHDDAYELAGNLETVLLKAGFKLKGFTFSGKPPLESLSKDGKFINVVGALWDPESDFIQLNIKELNFNKKKRGKKLVTEDSGTIPEKLTKRMCASKVGEVFDLTGRIAPLVAQFKLDLSKLNRQYSLGWNDVIPDSLRSCWVTHFQMIQELSTIRWKRAVIPSDAVSLEVSTIDCGDASSDIACAAIYVRYLRKNGQYSCQLIFARTKILPEGLTQPRRELVAALLCTHTGEVVRRALQKHHTSSIKLTDNQIVLHWLHNIDIPLKQWPRERVVEIIRWTNAEDWFYVKSTDMIADLGTRPGATISDVDQDSTWNLGFPWMSLPKSQFPMKSCDEVKLDAAQIKSSDEELMQTKVHHEITSHVATETECSDYARKVPKQVAERYKYSDYLLDPNKHEFLSSVRIIALVQKFIKKCRESIAKRTTPLQPVVRNKLQSDITQERPVITFSDNELQDAARYYFIKATNEVKHFLKPEHYEKFSQESEGILYYTGRVLPHQRIDTTHKMTAVMKDLNDSTFFVPIVDKHSPLAYSVINEVHWNDTTVKHSGVETTLRYTLLYCHIIEGRELVRKFADACERCRFLKKRTIEVSMGPVSDHQLRIAPNFYVSQVDLAGPFKAWSPHNKRTTIKIYLTVFCCAATNTCAIKVMEDYSTGAFVEAFIRFSCDNGFPKLLLIDEGAQLIKGCESMELNYRDIRNKLFISSNCQFETCPVSGHFMHGRVERKIRQIKASLEKSLCNQRLSVMQWETMVTQIANSVNNLPIGLRNKVTDLECADLLTPNRLRIARNNDRCPVGPMIVSDNIGKFMDENEDIFNSWYETWLISYVPTLMNHPKWFKDDTHLQEGDVIIFLKDEGHVKGVYQYGMIHEIKRGRDDKVRKVVVKYRNHNETFDRFSNRAVREIVVIHPVDELSILTELNDMQTFVNMQMPQCDGC